MDCYSGPVSKGDSASPALKIIRHPLYLPKSSPWLDLRVFYVRLSNYEVDDSTPEQLTLNHIPLGPDTIIELNGRRRSIYSECLCSSLRRDRVDKTSEEATFVSTDSIRMTGSVGFEVYDGKDLLLSGVLELCHRNGVSREAKTESKKWNMKCQSIVSSSSSFLRDKKNGASQISLPAIEVYVAGCFAGTPIILTRLLRLSYREKHQLKVVLDSTPECVVIVSNKEEPSEDYLQLEEYQLCKPKNYMKLDHSSIYSSSEYIEDDRELLWFNAGLRVGVGIGLGVCLGIGLGVGLLVRTYQATTRNFNLMRRLI